MFKSILNDDEVTKRWKTVFKIVYYLWLIVFFVRACIRIGSGGNSRQNEILNLWTFLSLFWLITYCGLYITYWIKPSCFRMSREQKVEGCDAPGVD